MYIQHARDTAENWQKNNPVLLSGEIAFETDTNLFKFGDGVKKYNDLPYAGTNADAKISAAIGDLGNKATVKAYVDAADATLQNSITELESTVGGLNLKALAHKDQVEETDLAEALATKINGKADKATTLEGYGITDAMTRTAIEGAISTAKSEAITDAEGKIATAKNDVIGTDLDESTDDTVKGAKKYADEVANKSTTDVIGTDKDASTKNTIYGVRKYTDEQVANATSTAANALKPVSDKANANEAAIAVIKGSGEGSITKAVADAKTELTTAIEAKQDKLTFTSTPDATNNKVVTQSYVDSNFAKLSGAMHYIGTAQSDPLAVNEHGSTDYNNWTMGDITVTNGSDTITTFHVGDVVSYGIKEYVCENTTEHPYPGEIPCTVKYTWRELGTEGSYAVKGSITDEDISYVANISVDKINDTELTRKITDVHSDIMSHGGIEDPDHNRYPFDTFWDGHVTLPFATAAKAGLVKVGSELEISSTGVLGIKELNVTKLVQSDGDTIIINCGDTNR